MPPWNLSPMIDEDGFVLKMYKLIPGDWEKIVEKILRRKSTKKQSDILQLPVRVRQVPGDGNCLFHSISTCFAYSVNETHLDMRNRDSLRWLYRNSAQLRQQAVDCLEESVRLREHLFLQGEEYIPAHELVDAAASPYGISAAEYCKLMRQDSYWGGGPEILALCNVLQRPIHVYELFVQGNKFVLRRMACFGSPKFDDQKALHILSADSRFPDIAPGKQLAAGNHFLAIFPEDKGKKQRLRGGDFADLDDEEDDDEEAMQIEKKSSHFRPTRWWRRLLLYEGRVM
jgi:hypothetical protein